MRWLIASLVVLALPAAAETVGGQGRVATTSCRGEDAVVRGSGNRVRFDGPCRSLRVEGDANVIEVGLARGATVAVVGDTNQVYYAPAGPPPVTTLRGYYDEVRPGPAPVAAATLMLDGSQSGRDLRCDGRDVVIRESAVRYVLRGGCRSLTIAGERVTVAAQLLPGAAIAVSAAGVVIDYALVADGPPPRVSATAGLQAAHLSRSGETLLRLPTTLATR